MAITLAVAIGIYFLSWVVNDVYLHFHNDFFFVVTVCVGLVLGELVATSEVDNIRTRDILKIGIKESTKTLNSLKSEDLIKEIEKIDKDGYDSRC